MICLIQHNKARLLLPLGGVALLRNALFLSPNLSIFSYPSAPARMTKPVFRENSPKCRLFYHLQKTGITTFSQFRVTVLHSKITRHLRWYYAMKDSAPSRELLFLKYILFSQRLLGVPVQVRRDNQYCDVCE